MALIVHITTKDAWKEAQQLGEYVADSIATEGFIHCSTAEQVTMPANAMYKGQTGLILLVIDEDAVEHGVVYEDCYESGHAFPHIYGALSAAAVVGTLDFPTDADGYFAKPDLSLFEG